MFQTGLQLEIMNKISLRRSGLLGGSRILRSPMAVFGRGYSKDDKDKEDKDIEEQYKVRKGVLHDKQNSLQEESYFHKEEIEQLKGLKKKLANEEEKKNEDKKN